MKRVKPETAQHLKLLFYGMPGSTKTRTAGSAALDERTSPVLFLDIGGNPLSIRDYKPGPDIIEIEALKDLNPIYDWLLKGQPENAPIVRELELRPPYKTVVVDGVTDLQRFSFATVVGNTKAGPGDLQSQTQIQHFNAVLAQMTTMARLFYKLPMHVIVTALEREHIDQTTSTASYRPLLLGQSATEVSGYAYVVARMMHIARVGSKIKRESSIAELAADTVSVALFKPTATYTAKDQYGALGASMVDPSITKMLDLIYPTKEA